MFCEEVEVCEKGEEEHYGTEYYEESYILHLFELVLAHIKDHIVHFEEQRNKITYRHKHQV